MIKIKRAYEEPADEDGFRMLIDRLSPRGLKKSDAKIDLWLKEIAPENELRKWYHQNPDEWSKFKKKYYDELKNKKDMLKQIIDLEMQNEAITLIYSSKDKVKNNATALLSVLKTKKTK